MERAWSASARRPDCWDGNSIRIAMYDDPTQPFRSTGFALPADVTLGRLRARIDLRSAIATRGDLGPADFDILLR